MSWQIYEKSNSESWHLAGPKAIICFRCRKFQKTRLPCLQKKQAKPSRAKKQLREREKGRVKESKFIIKKGSSMTKYMKNPKKKKKANKDSDYFQKTRILQVYIQILNTSKTNETESIFSALGT